VRSPEAATCVLHRLLTAHTDLRAEAAQIARGLLGDVSFESVADDVEHALRSLDHPREELSTAGHRKLAALAAREGLTPDELLSRLISSWRRAAR
jgi:hypothetical protein